MRIPSLSYSALPTGGYRTPAATVRPLQLSNHKNHGHRPWNLLRGIGIFALLFWGAPAQATEIDKPKAGLKDPIAFDFTGSARASSSNLPKDPKVKIRVKSQAGKLEPNDKFAPFYLPPHATLLPDAPLQELKVKIVEPADSAATNGNSERTSKSPTLQTAQRPAAVKTTKANVSARTSGQELAETATNEETVSYQFLAPQLSDGLNVSPVPVVNIKITQPKAPVSRASRTAQADDSPVSDGKSSDHHQLADLKASTTPNSESSALPAASDNKLPRSVIAHADPSNSGTASAPSNSLPATEASIESGNSEPPISTESIETAATSKPRSIPLARSKPTQRLDEVGSEIFEPKPENSGTAVGQSKTVNKPANAERIETALLPPATKAVTTTKVPQSPIPLPDAKPRREELAKRAAARQRARRRAAASRRRTAKAKAAPPVEPAATLARPQWARSALRTGN